MVRQIAFLGTALVALLLIHWAPACYYYWDEWHVLLRFREHGLGAAFFRHNEHVLPLFFAYYYGLVSAIGAQYEVGLLIGLALHCLNAFLLLRIVRELRPESLGGRMAHPVLVAMFLLAAVHAEVMQWLFEQSLLLSTMCMLGAGLLCVLQKRSWSIGAILGVFVLSFASPLFFGNGLITPGVLILLCYAVGGFRFARGQVACVASAIAGSLLAVGCYVLLAEGSGHGVEHAPFLADPLAFINYVSVGVVGVLSRFVLGLGGLERPDWPLVLITQSELLWVWGLLCIIPLGASSVVVSSDRPLALRLVVSGVLWSLGAYVLPGLGRAHFGVEQALSLRYTYAALPGVVLICAPAFERISLELTLRKWRFGNKIAIGVAVFWLCGQLYLLAGFDYFSHRGAIARAYFEARERAPKEQTAFPSTITPGLGRETVEALQEDLLKKRVW